MEVNLNNDINYDFQEEFISFRGYKINVYDRIWVLDINEKAFLKKISLFSESVKNEILNTFIYYAKYLSSTYTSKTIYYVLKYPEITGEKSFTLKGILAYKRYYNSKRDEPKVAILRTFLKKMYDFGYASVDNEIYGLLNSWRLRGSEKGIPVLSLDPNDGPFSLFEFQTIITKTNEYLAERKISYYEAALIRVFCSTGRRPIQISSLKVKDFYISDEYKFENRDVYVLNIPRAKMRYNSRFRVSFVEFGIRESVAQIISEHIQVLRETLSSLIRRELSKKEFDELPLFYDINKLLKLDWKNKEKLLGILPNEVVHITVNELTSILKIAVQKLNIHARDTGKPINSSSYRFRYTLGTNAARQKAGVNVIAKLLDHSDTQNAHIYVQNIPENARQISSIMDESLRQFSMAFQGNVVKNESAAKCQIENPERIYSVENDCTVGSCGKRQLCYDNAPIACYLCNKFLAWSNAPHHLILQQLIKEREYLISIECSLEVAAINDRVILAVQQVIDTCKDYNDG